MPPTDPHPIPLLDFSWFYFCLIFLKFFSLFLKILLLKTMLCLWPSSRLYTYQASTVLLSFQSDIFVLFKFLKLNVICSCNLGEGSQEVRRRWEELQEICRWSRKKRGSLERKVERAGEVCPGNCRDRGEKWRLIVSRKSLLPWAPSLEPVMERD